MDQPNLCSAVLLLGSNLGDRNQYIDTACRKIREEVGPIDKRSKRYETEAWGVETQNPYLNQALQISTSLSPIELLNTTQGIERKIGRVKKSKWNSRVIDIDILFFEKMEIHVEELKIPHPLLHERKFALIPCDEIIPDYIHPVFGKSITALLASCNDNLNVSVSE